MINNMLRMDKRIGAIVFIFLACLLLYGCGRRDLRQSLAEVETIIDDQPAEALSILEKIDSASLNNMRLRMHRHLLYAIALDKNAVHDGRLVREMAEANGWYEKFGNKHDKLRALYYYGDQLFDAGEPEEAAVRLMRTEREAVAQKDWFIAGMSARGLYHVYGQSHNHKEELSSIKRSVEYFNLAGKEIHEDDARLKLACAYYDDYELARSDSLFNEVIRIATQKRDTLRLAKALLESVDVMLLEEPYQPDSARIRILRSFKLGRRPSSRAYANLALSESLMGNRDESEVYLAEAYKNAKDSAQYYATRYRDYQIRLSQNEVDSAFLILKQLYSYTNSIIEFSLGHTVADAQNKFLEEANKRIEKDNKFFRIILVLLSLLVLSILVYSYVTIKRVIEKHRAEKENQYREFDNYRHASQELLSMGLRGIDNISSAYYESGNNKADATLKAYKSVVSQMWSDTETRSELIEKVDLANRNAITKLKEQVPSLTESQIMLFTYIVCGFSYTTTSVIMGDRSKQYVYTRKKRLVDSIKKTNPADKEFFLSYLVNGKK